jgi:hypothetical protein
LKITQFIKYGTFNKLCESFINKDGDIRNIVLSFIKGENIPIDKEQRTRRPDILLIDEIDVIFTKEFYGNTYNPKASLVFNKDNVNTKEINSLIKYIYS